MDQQDISEGSHGGLRKDERDRFTYTWVTSMLIVLPVLPSWGALGFASAEHRPPTKIHTDDDRFSPAGSRGTLFEVKDSDQ